MSNKKKYPFKKSILGMIPEGVSIDESYMINIADSMDLDVSDIIKQWSEVFDSNCGSSKEALQKTIDERDETIDSLERKLRIVISDRDRYKEQLSSPSKEIDLLNSQLEKSKASYVDLRTKYDDLCKEKREYDSLAQEYDNSVKECVDLNKQRKELKTENNKLKDAVITYKEDLEIIGGYYKDLQLDRNNICKELFRLRPELENAKDTICKLREDLEEQYKKIKYMEENCISKEVANQEMGYAQKEIQQRITDTKDLIRAIHTISKFI